MNDREKAMLKNPIDHAFEPHLAHAFKQVRIGVEAQPQDLQFRRSILQHTRRVNRRKNWFRWSLALILVLFSTVLQATVLRVSELLLVQLVTADLGLVGQIFWPINTAGGVLSVVLVGIRYFWRRIL